MSSRRLSDVADEALRAVGRGGCALNAALRELDLVVLVGDRTEEVGGVSSSSAEIVDRPGRDGPMAYVALLMQGLAGLINGDRKLLAHVVERLTAQVELDAAAVQVVDGFERSHRAAAGPLSELADEINAETRALAAKEGSGGGGR